MRDPSLANMRISLVLSRALRSIEDDQLSTGEIPNYRRLPNDMWEYLFSPLISAYVAEALAVFDPLSWQFDPFLVEQTAGRRRIEVTQGAARIRRRIRKFLAWQQCVDSSWRFFGRSSTLPPDADTTACSAAALLDRSGVHREAGPRPLEVNLHSLRSSAAAASRGCQMEDAGASYDVIDRMANINLYRVTVLTGGDTQFWNDESLATCRQFARSPESMVPLCYVLGLARWIGGLPGEAQTAEYAQTLIEFQLSGGSFGGPLRTAMGLGALLNFGYSGHAVGAAVRWLNGNLDPSASLLEEFCGPLCGSPSLTTAVAMHGLARAFLLANGAVN
jgi:hypothetical protein